MMKTPPFDEASSHPKYVPILQRGNLRPRDARQVPLPAVLMAYEGDARARC